MEEQINQRIAWIEKRVKLPELAKEYIAFQMMQFAKYYHIQQVNSVDLADVGGALPDDSGDVATESALNMGKTLDMGKQ